MTSHFYLVQRLTSRNPRDPGRGFDGHFECEYMGSSEFEWGSVPAALKRIREQRVVVEPVDVLFEGGGRTVYFVGHQGVRKFAQPMCEWARPSARRRAFYGKEWTHFDDVLNGTADRYVRTDAWWSLEDDMAWALDVGVANQLAAAFNARPVKR